MVGGSFVNLSFFSPLLSFSQAPTYFHDPTLDGIQSAVLNNDADLNGYLSQQVTISNQNANANTINNFLNTNTISIITNNSQSLSNSAALQFAVTNLLYSFSSAFSPTNYLDTTNDGSMGSNNATYTIPIFQPNDPVHTLPSMDLSLTFLNSFLPQFAVIGANLRAIILSIFSLVVLVWMVDYVFDYGKQLFSAKQTVGSTQEILGNNASAPIGLAYSAIITALIVTAIGFCASYFLTGGSGHAQILAAASAGSQIKTFTSTLPLWPIITSFIPVWGILTIFVNYLLFRYVLTYPIFMIVHTVVLFLIV